jgi:hypothetical protein
VYSDPQPNEDDEHGQQHNEEDKCNKPIPQVNETDELIDYYNYHSSSMGKYASRFFDDDDEIDWDNYHPSIRVICPNIDFPVDDEFDDDNEFEFEEFVEF